MQLPSDLLEGRRVLVLGFGRQGQALARWLPTVGATPVVTDAKDAESLGVDPDAFPRARFVLGQQPGPALIDTVDLVCVSGGVPLTHPLVQAAYERQVGVTNDAQLFIDRSPAPIIGITGSAGKTTTTALVGAMCRAAGWQTWVGGNIGSPLIDLLPAVRPAHQVVMELSSFQLEPMSVSPSVGGILNLTPNHLDRHGTMREYIRAKANIIVHQSSADLAVLNRDDGITRLMGPIVSGDAVWFSRHEIIADGAFLAGSRVCVSGHASPDGETHVVCSLDEIPLRGDHNVSNVLAACAFAGGAGVPPEALREAILGFQGVPHRLETVRTLNGVTWVNDSIATAPERVVAALHSYDQPIVLLLGGYDKALPWTDMMRLALSKARHIVAFGASGPQSAADIVVKAARELRAPDSQLTRVDTLDEAVACARDHAQPGDVVLLSPGGTSFDAYRDFAQRGDHFRALVAAL